MKNILTSLLLMLAISGFSQKNLLQKDDMVMNFGVGFGSFNYTGTYYSTSIPPISASFEYGILDHIIEKASIGVGGYMGLAAYKWDYNIAGSNWGYKYTNFILGGRGSFHYPLVEKLDTYAGVMIGFEIVSSKEYGTSIPGVSGDAKSGLSDELYIGARYYFTDNFAAMLELGYGISYVNMGIALKL